MSKVLSPLVENQLKTKIKSRFRPNNENQSVSLSIGKLLFKFAIVALVFYIVGYLILDYLDIYPWKTDSESFITNPKWVNEPVAGNVDNYEILGQIVQPGSLPGDINLETDNNTPLDMDILRSQRFYKSVSNSPEALKNKLNNNASTETNNLYMSINSLEQEIPSTYMVKICNQVLETNADNFKIKFKYLEPETFNKINKLISNHSSELSVNENEALDMYITKLNPLITILKFKLITFINLQMLDNNFSHPAHPFQFFKILNSETVKISKTENNNLELVINLIIHRELKTHTFNIQSTFIIYPNSRAVNENENLNLDLDLKNKKDIEIELQTLECLGSSILGEASISRLGYNKKVPPAKSSDKTSTMAPLDPELGLSGNIEAQVGINEEELRKEWKRQFDAREANIQSLKLNQSTYTSSKDDIATKSAESGYDPQLFGNYKCFGVMPNGRSAVLNEIQDPITCQSYHPEIKAVGVWDKACQDDLDCPYWSQDKGRGGCNKANGKCEMPQGVVRVGFRKTSKYSRPKCKGCLNGEDTGDCCNEQINPDYVFYKNA